MDKQKRTTHFGFKEVPWERKRSQVAQVFDSVAPSYDVMNDLMSMGMHRLWKRFTISRARLKAGERVLDLASGSGDLAMLAAREVGESGQVISTDINANMLAVGRDRTIDRGAADGIDFSLANAEELPIADNSIDCLMIGFGLRNVTDIDAALKEMTRVLRRGGRALVLEFSQPYDGWFRKLYDQYSFSILPKLGQWVANDAASYQYLAESIRRHPPQDVLKEKMIDAGLKRVVYHNLAMGAVAVHVGYK